METQVNDSRTKSEENENDVNMESGDSDQEDDDDISSGEDDDANETELRNNCDLLESKLNENPYLYDNHVALIKTLRELGDLEKLRQARQKMSEIFPLTEELWLEWLQDEIGLVSDDTSREEVTKLFERAVKDYLSIPIWLEYVQFSIGGMGSTDGVLKVREVFDRALIACGLHVTKGDNLWEAYREFENAILAGLLPAPGNVPTKEQEDKFSEQHDKVQALFKRQLTVPLQGLEETFEEYKDWLQDEPDKYTKQAYNKALIRLEKIKPYEHKLAMSESPKLEQYQEYIKLEEKEGDPARIQCLYERALQENCLNSQLWLQYTKYLDHTLRVPSVSIDVYERSIRNCPWCVQLWQNYILTLERSGQTYEKVKGLFEQALTSGFSQGSEVLSLWSTFIDYLRRRIKWNEDHTEQLETFRLSLEKAVEQLDNYGIEGDPNGTLRQFWAVIEVKFCNNLEKARQLWTEIMTGGRANEAALWMEYFRFERAYGDNKHCRRVLQRALNSVTDWPESIVDAYVNFERIEDVQSPLSYLNVLDFFSSLKNKVLKGNLEQYEQAVIKCEAQMERINERREKQAEASGDQKKKFDRKGQEKGRQKQGKFKQKGQQKQSKFQDKGQKPSKPYKQQQQHQKDQLQEQVQEIKPYKRKFQDDKQGSKETSDDGFKVPASLPTKIAKSSPPPGFKEGSTLISNEEKSAPPPGFKGKSAPPPGFEEEKTAPPPGFKEEKSAPPPGFKEEKTAPPPGFKEEKSAPPPGFKRPLEDAEISSKKKTKTEGDVSNILPVGESKDSRTVFLSNLSYDVDEEQIKKFFDKCGAIEEIRLIKNFKGRSKGYAYVEFADQLAVSNALTYDRTPVGGRPMYVSVYKAKEEPHKLEFKYANSLEKNKLFIKNLPFSCTEEALRTLYSQHGEVKDVRLVTYRSGAPKGLAYVEFTDEQCAAQAVLKTDGIKIGDHEISVAISNPPARKAPQRDESTFVPSLGGGKKETQSRHARTQVMLMPRAVTKKPQMQPKSISSSSTQSKESSLDTQSDSKNSTSTGMSNSDFRNMLLKK